MKRLLVAVLSVVVPVLLYADVVELTTGEKLEGKIIQKDESGVTLKVHYGLIIIEKKFIKSITTGESKEDDKKSGDDKKAGDQDKKAKEAELEARKLKTRLDRWVKSRNRLICKTCKGDGKAKCKYCKGTGQQYADQYRKTTRG